MSIILKCRDGEIKIEQDYYDKYLDFDWYLSIMMKYPNNTDNKGTDQDKIFNIFESKNALLSILDSLKFKRFVEHPDISLDYLEALCEMWCVPDWLKKEISDRRNDIYILQNKIYKCKNCHVGFKLSENKQNSCNTHNYHFNLSHNVFQCCGKSDPNDGCIKGYHIPLIID